ncbi:energy-coupling factor ABC transporter ATP-binding protein [Georgenia satyanarayanai]|uniref:energy-coupling factor ABC transporter ATP-binding protein n=1 Tax=Georgenia satyanarayanai TaxID=860221 RepID=UPI00203DB6C1|nr:ABC transporter ATP-binding protein [Georgenia satyanarayanai]MCM3659785.1 energy-coupling factor ABC transporter ATP-binding protein [Georgenia satyanarayanai]
MTTNPVVSVEGLSLRYHGAERRALDEVSFDVAEGEVIGILGATGAGKSTLLKTLAGVIPRHEHDAEYRGRVEVLGKDVSEYASLTDIAARVGLVMQDPEVQLVNTVVREELAWGMENRGVPVDEIQRRMDRAAELFGITELLDRFTHALSGGEKQRVVVASIFCLNPSVMLLDEPTSELDPAGTESVMRAIQVLASEGVTVLVVEHKVEELAIYADRLMVLDAGKVIGIGTPQEIFTEGQAPYRPQVMDIALALREKGSWPAERLPLSIDAAVEIWTGDPTDNVPQNQEAAR